MTHEFFQDQTEPSRIKAEIVSKYLHAWADVIIGQEGGRGPRPIAYLDLFCGPGRYEDGADSTPLLVLKDAIATPKLRDRLVMVFNDQNEDATRSLDAAIAQHPGIRSLSHRPSVHTGEVGPTILEKARLDKLPTFVFIDPFGYRGLSLQLINSVLKNWGCDGVFFFNYNRINMGLGNDAVRQHMDALFGAERADRMRGHFAAASLDPSRREAFVLEEMCMALRDMGGAFPLPFRFRNETGARTSHFLIFVSKAFRGYDIMKSIMAKASSRQESGVASFEYNPAEADTPMLFGLLANLEDLEAMLLKDYAGRRLRVKSIYESHSVGKPFTEKNYKDCLKGMKERGVIRAAKADGKSFHPRYMPDDAVVEFPAAGGGVT